MKVLVTGGAGYIGSHVVLQLAEAGHEVVVLDNLSTGHMEAVLAGTLVVGDVGDRDLLEGLFRHHQFEAVLHFAGSIVVSESVQMPLAYYRNNVAASLTLFEQIARFGVPYTIFSSSAAVYGTPDTNLITEQSPLAPINPYGASKLMTERMLADLARAERRTHFVALRYFNVAGADPQARLGEDPPEATHLIKIACEAALHRRDGVSIFGTDYPTPDGTCVRDYIHVDDLARAHLAALDYLVGGGASVALNCGYGLGYSVREVLDATRRVSRVDFPIREAGRRAGDPPRLVAAGERIRQVLDWTPRYADLDTIITHAWAWEQQLAERSPVSKAS